ncbi:MAG: T9SS type A sorting domain-containing protein [Chitinophagales bacterium]
MRSTLLTLILIFTSHHVAFSQPDYYYYNPVDAGVNDYYFYGGLCNKFLFIYTQDELASTGMNAPVEIHSIWLKSNIFYNLAIQDLKITLGHTTLNVPVNTFADNFNAGTASIVLDEPLFNYTVTGAPWNDPPTGWSEIPLTTPFSYNFSDNLAIQFEFSNCNYPIPLYANNGGAPVTVFTDIYGGSVANTSTARKMIGFSTGSVSPLAIEASDSSICEKFCVNFTDVSTNSPTSWQWSFEGGFPATDTSANPVGICYTEPGTYDVTLITGNASGTDTLFLNDFITVFPTPPFPVISQDGYELTCNSFQTYQWQLNTVDIPGATNQSFTASQTGFYTVLAGDSNSCKNSATQYVTITGISNVETDNGINVYPNPSSGVVNIELLRSSPAGTLSLDIKNIFGQTVYHWQKDSPIAEIRELQFSSETSGIFFLEVKAGDAHYQAKFVISR